MPNKKIRVLIIDDSATMRLVLAKILVQDDEIEVVGTANDSGQAFAKINELNPDVITLDVEMPGMDGITFLQKLMRDRPMPVVMVSSLTQAGSSTTLRALDLGAVDFFAKPKTDPTGGLVAGAADIITKVKTASQAQIVSYPMPSTPKPAAIEAAPASKQNGIIAIGASTGGFEAIRILLSELPPNSPGVLIAQHMPEGFAKPFSEHLAKACALNVKEAVNGDRIVPGTVLIAPGDQHMGVIVQGGKYAVRIGKVTGVGPDRSADVLFHSCVGDIAKDAVGIVLTGAGIDGAAGLKKMREAGARTIAQDEATSSIFEMPLNSIQQGGAEFILPLQLIAKKAYRLACGGA
jgi:two-component system chemotaxis response regulator CheB